MNQSQLLANKYKLPESREISLGRDKFGWRGFQELPLNRDIEALMTLALINNVTVNAKNDDYVITEGMQSACVKYYDDHPTELDALCEALCEALLAE